MKKTYIFILTIFTSIYSLHSQNLWGVDASIDIANAEFQNAFIETGTPGNYSTNNWTALSIFEGGGALTPGSAFWKRNILGYSQGAYWSGTTPINSPSNVNGIAIFDSDFLDNNGTQGAFGTGPSPSPHKGELISPRIDLSGNTNALLAVKFYSYYREFQITELSISFSSDDGVTWGNSVDYRTFQVNLSEGFITVGLPSGSTQGVTNLSQCRIKYTFDGDYYFAIIDDISIVALCSPTSSIITETACNSYISPSGNHIWTSSNTYYDTIPNVAGCDSIITVNLTINNSSTGTDTRTECYSYMWIDGNTYTSSNNTATFNIVGGAANGCDSLVTLDLTLLTSSTGTDTRSECDSYTWIDGSTYTSSNNTATFNVVGGAANGCDSLVTLDLTLLTSSIGTDTRSECDSYTWIDGNTYTSNNNTATFNIVGGAANGCDSLVTLDLTLLTSSTGTDTRSECDSYTWIDGNTYTSSNNTATFNIVGGAIGGCDSLVTLDLTIYNSLFSSDTTVNYVSNIEFQSVSPKIYLDSVDSLTSVTGCDSLISHYSKYVFNANYFTDSISVTDTLIIDVILTGIPAPNNTNTILVYPNPASDFVIINTGDYSQMLNYEIKIFNSLSQIVWQTVIDQQNYQIDVNSFGGYGLYFVYVLDNNGSVLNTKKLILQ